MSYDLYFYKKKDKKVDKIEIERYLKRQKNIISDNEDQFYYQNDATAVYFSFDYNHPNTEEILFDEIDESFEDTNFSFNINFMRPQFFGKEAFPFVSDFVDFFDLYILNPQGDCIPQKYKDNEILKDWEISNLKISKSYYKELNLNYLSEKNSNYIWEYCLQKDDLQKKLGEEYFVPNIFYLKLNKSSEVKTICIWTEGMPFVLPKTDYVSISKKFKKFFITKEEVGVVAYKTIIEKFGQSFQDESLYKILHPEKSEEILKDFNNLKLETTIKKLGEGISVDKFVNIKDE